MAQFAPYQQQQPLPSYLGLSKEPGPIKPNVTLGKAFEGLADIFEQGIKGFDEVQHQEVIKEAQQTAAGINESENQYLRQEIDKERGITPSVSEDALPTGANPVQGGPPLEGSPLDRTGGEPLPPDAQRAIQFMGKVDAATEQGKYRDTDRQAWAEAKKSELLSKYPGRAKEIHAEFAKFGLGENQQNVQLRATLNEIRQQKAAKEAKDEAWENSNRDWLIGDPASGRPGVMPNYFEIPAEQRRAPAFRDQLQKRIGNFEGQLKMNQLDQSDIATKKARGEDITTDQKRVFDNKMQLDFSVSLSAYLTRLGYKSGNPDEIISDFRRQGNIDPKLLDKFVQDLNQFETMMRQKWLQDAHNTPVDKMGTGATALSTIGAEELTKMANNRMVMIDTWKKAITDKDFGLAHAATREATTLDSRVKADIARNAPSISVLGGIREKVGDGVVGLMYPQFAGKVLGETQQLIDGRTTNIIKKDINPLTGKTWTQSDIIDEYMHKWNLGGNDASGRPMAKPNDMAALMDRAHGNLMNPKVPNEYAKEFATSIFSDPRLLSKIVEGGKYDFMVKYAQPDVGEKIYSFGDQKLIEDYKRFMAQGVTASIQEAAANIREELKPGLITDNSKRIQLQYNPETRRIDALLPDTAALMKERGPVGGAILDYQIQKVRDAVPKLNNALGLLEPVFKRGGAENVDQALIRTLLPLGINVKVPDELLMPKDQGGKAGSKTGEVQKTQWDTLMADPNKPHEYNGISFTSQEFKEFLSLKNMAMPMGPVNQDGAPPASQPTSSHPITGKPMIQNSDGSVSTERTITVGTDKGFVNIPTIINGKQVTQQEAIDAFRAGTNKAVGGPFPSIMEAEKAAVQRSQDLGRGLGKRSETNSLVQTASVQPLHDVIRRAEGVAGDKGYNTIYGGTQVPLTNMTINEALDMQASLPKDQRAIGAGQFIPKTLKSLVKEMKLSGDEKMTPELQDRMIETLMERRGLSKWREGKISDEKFIDNLSEEWAGLPGSSGLSAYHGDRAGNKATVPLRRIYDALDQMKQDGTGPRSSLTSTEFSSQSKPKDPATPNWRKAFDDEGWADTWTDMYAYTGKESLKRVPEGYEYIITPAGDLHPGVYNLWIRPKKNSDKAPTS